MRWATRRHVVFVVLALLFFSGAGPALAQQGPNLGLTRAVRTNRIKSGQNSNLTTKPALLGSFEIVGTAASGNVTIWDSQDGTSTHAQAVVIAEGGVTALKGSFASGTINRLTQFGLFVETNDADAIVSWSD